MADRAGDTGTDFVAWAREHWRAIAALLFVAFLFWRFSGKRPEENGRYILVKDDVPCQAHRESEDGRRWCYLVLDTRSGRLEERVRKVGGAEKKK